MLAVLPSAQGQTVLPTMPISNTEIQVSGNDVVGAAVIGGPVGSSGLELCAAWAREALSHQTMNSGPYA